jgi:hypothetical protein
MTKHTNVDSFLTVLENKARFPFCTSLFKHKKHGIAMMLKKKRKCA